jgi:hypothetical protein
VLKKAEADRDKTEREKEKRLEEREKMLTISSSRFSITVNTYTREGIEPDGFSDLLFFVFFSSTWSHWLNLVSL